MAHETKDDPKKIQVEDLLRMKRAERPDPAFWERFDRELHERMLQTLVKKEPWYLQTFRALSGRIAQSVAVVGLAVLAAYLFVVPNFEVAPQVETAGTGGTAEEGLGLADGAGGDAARAVREAVLSGPALASAAFNDSFPASGKRSGGMEFAGEAATRDYAIDAVSSSAEAESGVRRDFAMDSIRPAGDSSGGYHADEAGARRPFGNGGSVASLVY